MIETIKWLKDVSFYSKCLKSFVAAYINVWQNYFLFLLLFLSVDFRQFYHLHSEQSLCWPFSHEEKFFYSFCLRSSCVSILLLIFVPHIYSLNTVLTQNYQKCANFFQSLKHLKKRSGQHKLMLTSQNTSMGQVKDKCSELSKAEPRFKCQNSLVF